MTPLQSEVVERTVRFRSGVRKERRLNLQGFGGSKGPDCVGIRMNLLLHEHECLICNLCS